MFALVWSLSHVWLFETSWTIERQAPPSSTISQSLLKFIYVELVILCNHLVFYWTLLLCLQSFPASCLPQTFPISQLFTSGDQNISASASASVLPMNIQGWFPLGLTSLISLESKGLSRALSNTTVQKDQFLGTQLPLRSNSHIHTWLLEIMPRCTFVGKVVSLLFNIVSKFVRASLPRSKHF